MFKKIIEYLEEADCWIARTIQKPIEDFWFEFKKRFKRFINKGRPVREDLWNLDWYLFQQIYYGVKSFDEMDKISYPMRFKNFKEWEKYLKEMKRLLKKGFDIGDRTYLDDDGKYDKEQENKDHDDFNKGLKMFIDVFWDLWD